MRATLRQPKSRPLKNTLDLFDGESTDLLLFCLCREHGISVYEPDNLSRKKIEAAFEAVFGLGAGILIQKFDYELKSAN